MRLSRASNHYSRLIALSAVAAFATIGCSDGTAPKVPSLVEAVATTPSATAGIPLAVAPTFSVKDASGIMLAGVPVTIVVTAGGGSLAGAPTTTAPSGPTSIGTWTLGKTAGPNTVSVTVGNLQPLLITVNGVAGPPAAVVITGGNSQSALAGTLLPAAVTAQVQDQFGNAVAGSVVNFSIIGGGGTLSASIVTADANGNAAVTWRLGKSAVPQIAAVSSQGFTTNAIASVRSDYSVDLRFFGPTPPAEALAAFTEAAARVSAIIVGDIPDLDIPTVTGNTGLNLSSCGVSGQVLNERVDDLIIYATVVSIDGPGKILASAGPCFVRLASGADCVPPTTPPATCNGFPLVGVMRFDADDIAGLVASGRLNGVVLHEMLHVVGIGTNWRARSLLAGAGTLDPRYLGSLGIAGCNEAGGTLVCATGIPVENTGGAGTADAHWRESVFDTEIMTGFAEGIGVATPLSNMTVQSLSDEGYTVNSAAADPYTIPGLTGLLGLRGSLSASETSPFDIVVQPSFGITRTGSVRKLLVTQ